MVTSLLTAQQDPHSRVVVADRDPVVALWSYGELVRLIVSFTLSRDPDV